jgi:hypothetical protein
VVGQRRANDRCRKVAATANDFTNDVCRKFQRRMPQATPQRPTMVAARFNEACRRNAAAVNDRANDMRRRRFASRNEAVKVQAAKEGHAVRLSALAVFAGQKSDATWIRASQRQTGRDTSWTKTGHRAARVWPCFGHAPDTNENAKKGWKQGFCKSLQIKGPFLSV